MGQDEGSLEHVDLFVGLGNTLEEEVDLNSEGEGKAEGTLILCRRRRQLKVKPNLEGIRKRPTNKESWKNRYELLKDSSEMN